MWDRDRKKRCRNCARAAGSKPSSVSINKSKYASFGRIGTGAGAPELGVTGVDLTSNVPAGSGARCFQKDRGSKQNTNHQGPSARTCSKTTVRVPRTITQEPLGKWTKNKENPGLPERRKSKTNGGLQESGRRNSKPKIRSSPADSCRRTRAAIGGVS